MIDGIVNGVANLVRGWAGWLRLVQTGLVKDYALSILVGVAGSYRLFRAEVGHGGIASMEKFGFPILTYVTFVPLVGVAHPAVSEPGATGATPVGRYHLHASRFPDQSGHVCFVRSDVLRDAVGGESRLGPRVGHLVQNGNRRDKPLSGALNHSCWGPLSCWLHGRTSRSGSKNFSSVCSSFRQA